MRYRIEKEKNTCRRSSKSRAANFFIADALLWNFRMVERPNEGTLRYLSQEYENEIYEKPLQLTENLEWI